MDSCSFFATIRNLYATICHVLQSDILDGGPTPLTNPPLLPPIDPFRYEI